MFSYIIHSFLHLDDIQLYPLYFPGPTDEEVDWHWLGGKQMLCSSSARETCQPSLC